MSQINSTIKSSLQDTPVDPVGLRLVRRPRQQRLDAWASSGYDAQLQMGEGSWLGFTSPGCEHRNLSRSVIRRGGRLQKPPTMGRLSSMLSPYGQLTTYQYDPHLRHARQHHRSIPSGRSRYTPPIPTAISCNLLRWSPARPNSITQSEERCISCNWSIYNADFRRIDNEGG